MSSREAPQQVAAGTVVTLHYTLYDEQSQVLDTSGEAPIAYLHGAENIVAGLEQGLIGRSVGERVEVVVEPLGGYGERAPGGVHKLPREHFPDDVELAPGMPLGAEDPQGRRLTVWIVAVEPDGVTLDLNHPLAGKTLRFDVHIEAVRAATSSELEAGRPLD